MKILKCALAVVAAALPALSHAGYLPYGMQSNVSADTVSSWGWSQCYRLTNNYSASITNKLLPACAGDYLMLGLYNAQTKTYAVLGGGDFDVVSSFAGSNTSLTTQNLQALDNWSNGLNFYRATYHSVQQGFTVGQWGFTTNSVVNLYVQHDLLLSNGYSQGENTGGAPSSGLSLALSGEAIAHSGIYNIDGQHFNTNAGMDPVLLSLSGPLSNTPPGTDPGPGDGDNPGTTPVPEPSSLALFGLGIGGVRLASRRKRQIS